MQYAAIGTEAVFSGTEDAKVDFYTSDYELEGIPAKIIRDERGVRIVCATLGDQPAMREALVLVFGEGVVAEAEAELEQQFQDDFDPSYDNDEACDLSRVLAWEA